MSQVLLSVPAALSAQFPSLTGRMPPGWFATNDPVGRKLGSGGGTAHLIHQAWRSLAPEADFKSWAREEKRLISHAGGQRRRLPAYASGGKALVPVPIFRWMRGPRIDQALLDLQLPLLESLVEQSPPSLRWLIASGDALVWNEAPMGPRPDVDGLWVGLWDNPERVTPRLLLFVAAKSHLAFRHAAEADGRRNPIAHERQFLPARCGDLDAQ
jgi:hypothetical protein